MDEEGNLKLDKEALNELTESRLNDMRVQALNNVVDNISAIEDDAKANEYLKSTNYALAESYEDVAENALKSARAKMEDAVASGSLSKANMEAVFTKAESDIKKINKLFSSVNKDLSSDVNSSKSSKSSTSSSDPVKDAFEKEYNLLKHNLEMEYITEEQYYNGVQALNEKYFAGKEDYIDEYRKYEEEVYKGLQSYYKDYIDKKTDYFEKALDANKISFVMYSNAVKGMLDGMWRSGKISAADYWSYVEKMLNKQKDIYDRVLSAVADTLDDEIDAWDEKIDRLNEVNDKLEEQQDLYDKALSHAQYLIEKEIEGYDDLIDKLDEFDEKLNEQKDDYDSILSAVDNVYADKIEELNKQSDAIQDQIDLLNDENSALDLQYRKQQAIANLQKARQQRTKMVYSKDKGFHYVTDGDAVRDAEKELKDIETEELIDSLEKEKEALADAVEELEKYRDLWSEIADIYDKEMDKQLLIALYGENAEGLILRNRMSDIENFRDNYIAVQKQLNSNDELRQSYEEKKKYYNELRDRWAELTDAIERAEQEQAAIQVWGADYAKIIMDGRESDLTAFRDKYIAIQNEINSNDELIKSYEEKKEYYSRLKEQWNDISSAYENAVNRQYAAQILGANWEKDVLNGRMDVLTDFKNRYVSLQQEIANAAEASARAQANAANNLNTSSSSSASSSSSGNSSVSSTSSTGTQKYKAYIGEEPVGVYNSQKEAEDAVKAVIEQRSSYSAEQAVKKLTGTDRKNSTSVYNNTKTGVGSDLTKKVKIEKYHTGLENGLIGKRGNEVDFELIQKLGLKPYEFPAILKSGEAVITSEQISNLADSFRNNMFPQMKNYIPDLSAVKSPTSFTVGDIHVTCPGITSNDVAKQIGSALEKEFKGMSLYATQKMSITR